MSIPDDVWDELLDKQLAESRQSVAKVACYLVDYVLDRTGSRLSMQHDPLYMRAIAKLKALAHANEVPDPAVMPDEPGKACKGCRYLRYHGRWYCEYQGEDVGAARLPLCIEEDWFEQLEESKPKEP